MGKDLQIDVKKKKEVPALFLSVNHHKWPLPPVLMTLSLNTNETRGFCKRSEIIQGAAARPHQANTQQMNHEEPSQRSRGENYNVIPTFNIITIFIALFTGQEQASCFVSSQNMCILNSLPRRDEFQNIRIVLPQRARIQLR